VLYFLR